MPSIDTKPMSSRSKDLDKIGSCPELWLWSSKSPRQFTASIETGSKIDEGRTTTNDGSIATAILRHFFPSQSFTTLTRSNHTARSPQCIQLSFGERGQRILVASDASIPRRQRRRPVSLEKTLFAATSPTRTSRYRRPSPVRPRVLLASVDPMISQMYSIPRSIPSCERAKGTKRRKANEWRNRNDKESFLEGRSKCRSGGMKMRRYFVLPRVAFPSSWSCCGVDFAKMRPIPVPAGQTCDWHWRITSLDKLQPV
jgi:hypothetical protein